MPPLNLDTLISYLAAEPATPASGQGGASPSGLASFGEHLQRARQTAGTAANTNYPPADTDRPADPKPPPATEDRPATGGDSPAVESDPDATPGPDPARGEPDPSETGQTESDAGKEIDDSATEATSDREVQTETDDLPAEAVVAAVEPDPAAGNRNDEAAAKSINEGEMSGDPPAPDETGPAGQHESQPNARQSPTGSAEQQPPGAAASGNRVADGPQEEGQARAETMRKETADTASTAAAEEVIEPTVAELPGQRNDAVPAASETANSQHEGTTPRGRRKVRGPATDPSGELRSGEIAKEGKSAKIPPNQRLDTPAVAADEINAEVGDPTAEMNPTAGGEADTSGPIRAAAGQAPRPGAATGHSGNSAPDQVDRVRFVQRVARAFEAIGDRGGSIRLRLHPPELGSLRLHATIRNGLMTVRLETETETARSILLDNLPALRDRLATQEIKIQQFDVDLTDQSFGGSAEQPGGDPQPHDHPNDNAPNRAADQPLETQHPSQPGTTMEPDRGNRLDVIA